MSGIIECGFGIYQINDLYPVPKKQIVKACSKIVANYSNTSANYRKGLRNELYVRYCLNKLEGVTAWRTPDGSYADCILKWDLVVKVEDSFYVLQIKSSEEGAMRFIEQYEEQCPTIVWIEDAGPCDENELINALSKLFGRTSVKLKAETIAAQICWNIRVVRAVRGAINPSSKTTQMIEDEQIQIQEEERLLSDPLIADIYKKIEAQLKEKARVFNSSDKNVTQAYYQKLADESVFIP